MNMPERAKEEMAGAVEELAAHCHAVYQAELRAQGVKSRHVDAYEELPEDIKHLDRALARFILARDLAVRAAVREEDADAADAALQDAQVIVTSLGNMESGDATEVELDRAMKAALQLPTRIRALGTSAERDALHKHDEELTVKEQSVGAALALAWLTATLNAQQPIVEFWQDKGFNIQQLRAALAAHDDKLRIEVARITRQNIVDDIETGGTDPATPPEIKAVLATYREKLLAPLRALVEEMRHEYYRGNSSWLHTDGKFEPLCLRCRFEAALKGESK
jgi:DNA-binding transcriptional MerR regulator